MALATQPTQATTFVVSDPVARLKERFGENIPNVSEFRGETTITLAREHLLDATRMLRDEIGFEECTDVTALDWKLEAKNSPTPGAVLLDGDDLDSIEPP